MRNKQKLSSVIYLISGIFFFIASITGKNYAFIPIGCCFVILGITTGSKGSDDKGDK